MNLAIGLLLASWAPNFTAANLRHTEERAIQATDRCGDCCKSIDQAASIVQSALLGCGHAATGYSGGGSSGWGVSSTAMAYQPPNPTCLLILCAAQRSASAIVRNACAEEYEPVIGADICEYVPGFTPPIAKNDFGTITQGETKEFAVLDNDRAVPDRYLVISAITQQASEGTCVVKFNQDNKIVHYEANTDALLGADSCEYETCYENGPRLCDTATLTMDITASPTQAPTTAPTTSPIEGCNIGLDIACLDCDDQDLATNVKCTKRPTAMNLKYIGGECGQGNNNQGDHLSCADFNGGPPTVGNAFIKVIGDKRGVYFKDTRKVGDFSPLVSHGKEFDSNLEVFIYESEGGKILQKIEFHSSCSQDLFLLDKFGAVQIASFTNNEQNKVTVRGQAELEFRVSNDSSENITNIELKLFTKVISSNLNLGVGEVTNILQDVPLDLSVQQVYRYVLNAEGEGKNGRDCTGTVEREFLIPSADRV